MPSTLPELEFQLVNRFETLPEHEKVQMFIVLATLLLDDQQVKHVIKLLQERIV